MSDRSRRQSRKNANWRAIEKELTAADVVMLREFSESVGREWLADGPARYRACDLAFCYVRDRLIAGGKGKRWSEGEASRLLGLPEGMGRMMRRDSTVPENEDIATVASTREKDSK
jgi:hypothetical protein